MTGGTPSAAPRSPASARDRQLLRVHHGTLAALLDATTFRHLDGLGVAAGQRCWEAGAGGATVPAWLARRTGPAGRVLATDTDLTFLQEADGLPCEIARHDIGADPAPPGAFDLVHARLVLEHVPGRDAALATMIRALRPGGWLLVESGDPGLQPLACPDEAGPAQGDWPTGSGTRAGSCRAAAPTSATGARFPVGSEAPASPRSEPKPVSPLAGPAAVRLQRTMIERARDRLIAKGMATTEEIDEHLADIDAGRLDLTAFPVVSAWGRKSADNP